MFYEIIRYAGECFCPAIAERVFPVLLYSGILQKYVGREAADSTRYRLNVMLQWEYGWWKSSILQLVARWLPSRCHELTSSSAAAIRGSFADGRFYVPELLLSDVMVVPELSAILRADEETVGALLVAMEEASVRVALVKGANLSEEQVARAREYGASIVDDRLCYRNRACVWTATHTIDNLPDALRDALLSRFYVCHVSSDEIDPGSAWRNPKRLFDEARELEFCRYLKRCYEAHVEPDHDFADEVLDLMRVNDNKRRNPREVGDLRRMALAHRVLVPGETPRDVSRWLAKFLSSYAGLTTREVIAQYIYQSPRTLSEILKFTGGKKANILGHLKRMGALRVGSSPVRYYIDSMTKPEAAK